MPTEIEYLGGGSIGVLMPTTLQALAAADAAIAVPTADLEAQIAGAVAAGASITVTPPSFDLAAAIEGALQLPGVSIDVTMMASVAAQLNIELGVLEAALSLIAALRLPFTTAGVHAWKLEGAIGGMAGALGSQINGGMPGGSGPQQEGFAIVLLAGSPVSIQALKTLFPT